VVVTRGEIWWADLPNPVASEPGYRRPILIIQSDEFNKSQIRTIIAVALTSNTKLRDAPGNVLLAREETGLSKNSVANVSQIMTLDRSFLTKIHGSITQRLMTKVDTGFRLILSL